MNEPESGEELTASFAADKPQGRTESVVMDTKLYWCSLILGFAVLEPWNEILSCMNYFQDVYQPSGHQPQFTLPMLIYLPIVLLQVLLIPYGKFLSVKVKVVTCMAILSFFVYVFLILCRIIENKNVGFMVIIVLTLIIGVFNGIQQSSIAGLVGAMGCAGKYMGANVIGNGLSGIVANLLTFMTIAVIGNASKDEFKATLIFFIVMAALMTGCVFVAYITLEAPYVKDVVENLPEEKPLKEIFKISWPVFKNHGKNVFVNFMLTFIVFPGIAINSKLSFMPIQWSIPFIIFLFNFFDTVGRFITSNFSIVSSKAVKWLCLFRITLVVTTCLIGFKIFDGMAVVNWLIIINMIIFATTNGMVTNLSMIYGISESEPNEREDAGKLMTIFLTGGIFTGTIFAQFVFAQFVPA